MEKTTRQNRIREVLGKLYDQHPPHFREYARRFEEDPSSRVFAPLAEAHRRMGQVDEAIAICKTGLSHHPDFHGGRVALAKCYIDKKQFDLARKELETVVSSVPENLLAQKLLGETCLSLKDRKGAQSALERARELSPQDDTIIAQLKKLESEPEEVSAAATDEDLDEIVESSHFPKEAASEPLISSAPVEETAVAPPQELPEESPGDGEFLIPSAPIEEELPSDPAVRSEINALLGVKETESEDDAFKIQHVSNIFIEPAEEPRKEITTETLGDLYFSQEQYQKSLEIFEKLASQRSSASLRKKLNACREKLGVDPNAMVRSRQIEMLQGLLKKSKSAKAHV